MAPAAANVSPPVALDLTATTPAASVRLHQVIVFHGPGSWKRDAYWDEYVMTLTASARQSLTVDAVTLVDADGQVTPAGDQPWSIDRVSRERLKVARHLGRDILLGAGTGAAWLGSMALFASNFTLCGAATNSTAAAVGATGVVVIPAIALGSGVRTLVARGKISREFNRRRLAVPMTLAPGASRTGSFFFPVTPAPARLVLRGHDDEGTSSEVTLELTGLTQLHLRPATDRDRPPSKGNLP